MTMRALFAVAFLGFLILAACQPGSAAHGVSKHAQAIRRQGTLVLSGDNTAYDLDSLRPDWNPLRNAPWVDQNIVYVPDFAGGAPGLRIADEPASDVLMGSRGPWTYRDCLHARYDRAAAPANPNVPAGPALDIGHGICVHTSDTTTPDGALLKSDGGHYVLLVVRARTPATLTLAVTVWK
jgi:hypothetical protein